MEDFPVNMSKFIQEVHPGLLDAKLMMIGMRHGSPTAFAAVRKFLLEAAAYAPKHVIYGLYHDLYYREYEYTYGKPPRDFGSPPGPLQ